MPFRVTFYTKLHEFQYKVLNKCLTTDVFLHKIGIYLSPACSFCGDADETLEYILVYCNYSGHITSYSTSVISNFSVISIRWLLTVDSEMASFLFGSLAEDLLVFF